MKYLQQIVNDYYEKMSKYKLPICFPTYHIINNIGNDSFDFTTTSEEILKNPAKKRINYKDSVIKPLLYRLV